MYAALFETGSWLGRLQFIQTGSSASELLFNFEKVQDLRELVTEGKTEERKKKAKADLLKLEALLYKRVRGELTIEDLLTLDISLSVGCIKCVEVIEGENALAEMIAKYPLANLPKQQ